MWRKLSLLFFCCAVSGLDASQADRSADPSREKMLPTAAAELGKPDKDAPSADSQRRGAQQLPGTNAAPVVGALGKVEQPIAEPLEDEMDNQENIVSQVITVCALIYLLPDFIKKNSVISVHSYHTEQERLHMSCFKD